MRKFLKRAALVVALAVPTIVFAQEANGSGDDERRRFFGSSTTCGACNPMLGYKTCTKHFYVLWIDFDGSNTYPPC